MEEEFPIKRSIEPAQLSWPPDSDLASEDFFVRGYIDMRGLNWEDVSDTLKVEREILARVARNLSVTEEATSDEEYFNLYGLDVGVSSAVVALSAANCAPIASCNGAAGHHEAHPCIAFFCRKGRVRDLLKAAELARCGLVNGEPGSVILYARNIEPLLLFAERLIEMRDQLKPLSSPYARRRRQLPNRNPDQLTLGLFQDEEGSG